MPDACQKGVDRLAEVTQTALPANTDLVKSMWHSVVEAWMRFSTVSQGGTSWNALHRAYQISVDKGFPQHREACAHAIYLFDTDSFLQATRFERPMEEGLISVSNREVNRLLSSVSGDPLRTTLCRFGGTTPWSVEETLAQAEHEFNTGTQGIGPSLSQHLITARAHYTDSDEGRIAVLASQRIRHDAVMTSLLILCPFLDRLGERTENDFAQIAAEFAESVVVDAVAAERIGTAFKLYWQGEFDASAHLSALMLERSLRRMAYLSWRVEPPVPRIGTDAEHPGLGTVLAKMTGAMPDDHRNWLKQLLTDTPGFNLRNDIGHGESHLIDQPTAGLLLQACCSLLCVTQLVD